MPTINLYPNTSKPPWLEDGVKVHCLGEGFDVFLVYDNDLQSCSCMLLTLDGYANGRESWSKLIMAICAVNNLPCSCSFWPR